MPDRTSRPASGADAPTGPRFECTRCGQCCWTRGSYSHVYLAEGDLERLARAKGVSRGEFRDAFTFRGEDGWTELDFVGGRCILLDPATSLCTVYESRPTQCRTFPFWPELIRGNRWTAEARRMCEGVGQGPVVPKEEVAARMAAQEEADEG